MQTILSRFLIWKNYKNHAMETPAIVEFTVTEPKRLIKKNNLNEFFGS